MLRLKAIGVIPARYDSTRLPGKPLKDINGKSMIVRVAEQAAKSRILDDVIVATDSELIKNHLTERGIKVCMTGSDIRSGTDRCYEAVKNVDCDIVVNIQGDEPLLDPDVIDRVVDELIRTESAVCCTPVIKIGTDGDPDSKNTVKVVMNNELCALYFSRSRIPNNFRSEPVYYKHIGLYAYRSSFLKTFVKLPSTTLETAESLEQLRILENGYRIKCVEVFMETAGVDTQEDLDKVRRIITDKEGRVGNTV